MVSTILVRVVELPIPVGIVITPVAESIVILAFPEIDQIKLRENVSAFTVPPVTVSDERVCAML